MHNSYIHLNDALSAVSIWNDLNISEVPQEGLKLYLIHMSLEVLGNFQKTRISVISAST